MKISQNSNAAPAAPVRRRSRQATPLLALLAGVCMALLLSPAAALAAVPTVSSMESAPTGATSEEFRAEVDPRDEATEYRVNYAEVSSTYCSSSGVEGKPVQTALQKLPQTDGAEHREKVSVSGLKSKAEYCWGLQAVDKSGESAVALHEFTAGAPQLSIDEVNETSATSAGIELEINAAGQRTEYDVEYASAESEWCESEGVEGAPTGQTGEQVLPEQDGVGHFLNVPVTGLVAGDEYCALVIARNASGTATEDTERFQVGRPYTYLEDVIATGAATATAAGYIETSGESVTFAVGYALSTTEWCKTGGQNASYHPEGTTPFEAPAASTDYYTPVSVPITVATAGKEYCAALILKSPLGTIVSDVRTFTAGSPSAELERLTGTGSSSESVLADINPTGQASTYQVGYAEQGSAWCSHDGTQGEALGTSASVSLPFQDDEYHEVTVELTGLNPAKFYCAAVIVVNASAKAYSSFPEFQTGLQRVQEAESQAVNGSSENITAEVDPNGEATTLEVRYGLSSSEWCEDGFAKGTAEAHTTQQAVPFSDSTYHSQTVQLSGLTGGDRYCAEVLAAAPGGSSTTSAGDFFVGLPALSGITPAPAGESAETISAEIDPTGQSTNYTLGSAKSGTAWCETDGSSGTAEATNAPVAVGATDDTYHAVTATVTGLQKGNEYCTVLVASNGSGSERAKTEFTDGAPAITSQEQLPISPTSEKIGADLNPNGESTTYRVEYALGGARWCSVPRVAPEFSTSVQTLPESDVAAHPVSVELTGLKAGSEYCAELIATNGSEAVVEGGAVYFKAGEPQLTMFEATAIESTSAQIPGEIDPAGQAVEYHVGYGPAKSLWCEEYGEVGSPEKETSSQSLGFQDATQHAVAVNLTGLTPSTAYCAALIVTYAGGTVQEGRDEFTTLAAPEQKSVVETKTTTTTTTTTSSVPPVVLPTLSVHGSVFSVPAGTHLAEVKIACSGAGLCKGKASLIVRVVTGSGRKKHSRLVTIGTVSFSITAGHQSIVKITLNKQGRALLGAGHGHLRAILKITRSGSTSSQTKTIQIVQQKQHKKK